MRARFTTVSGTKVLCQATQRELGVIADILIHPDTGKIEGFFVSAFSVFSTQNLFLSSSDIVRWGRSVAIREEDVLGPLDERVRLQSLLHDNRRVLHQKVVTEDGQTLGRVRDVQFSTKTFELEWIFPRHYFRWGSGIPVQDILEVRTDAVVVRAPVVPVIEQELVAG